MLIINEKYMEQNITIEDVLSSIEKALLIQESGKFSQPDRIHLGKDENMLIINEKYMEQNITIEDVLSSIEKALLIQESGKFSQPDRIHLGKDENPFLLMPCFKEDYFSTKLITVYPKNSEIGEAVTQGVTLLNDIKTGKPLALLNGTYLTALRTGCVGGVSSN